MDDTHHVVEIRWFEQSHFSFATRSGTTIHVDPFLSRVVKPESHIFAEPLVAPADVTADYVFLTHDHRDHTDPHTLVPIARHNSACLFVGSEESCARCRDEGIEGERLRPVAEGGRFTGSGFSVDVVHAENTSDSDATTHLGFVFSFDGRIVYVTGDTRTEVASYRDKLEAVEGLAPDLLIVPINEKYHNPGPTGARELIELTKPERIVPCHFGCFKNNTIDPNRFVEELPPEYRRRVRILSRGERLEL